MIEVAHRQHGSPSFRPTSTTTSSASFSPSRPAPDLAPLPVRHLRAPPSPLVNNFTSSAFSEEETQDTVPESEESRTADFFKGSSQKSSVSRTSKIGEKHTSLAMSGSGSQASSTLVRRIRKGQKWEDFQPPPCSELPSIQAIDSSFQLQEYLCIVIRQDPHNVEQIVSLPQPSPETSRSFADSGMDKGKARDPESTPFGSMDEESQPIDEDVWIYEQLRRLVLDFSTPWLTMLQTDCDRKKSPKTCEAMNADDWMYLCASHGEEKQCCAIDYIIHTLDGTTALLNSQRHFPSRTFIPTTSLRHFGSISRRLSRIFVHAYEHHRDVFEACEAETSLYARFLALVQTYDLISVDALPRLGAAAANEEGEAETESSLAATGESDEGSVLGSIAGDDSGKVAASRGSSDKRQLFEAGTAASNNEDDEDEVGLEEGAEDEQMHPVKTRLERSDSASSRVTTIHVGPMREEEPTPQVTETLPSEVVSPREKPGREEVPQDVKDEEEEE